MIPSKWQSRTVRSFFERSSNLKIIKINLNMSRLAIVLFALLSVAFTAPINEKEVVQIVKQRVSEPAPDGSYNYEYETANGIQVAEEAQVNVGGDVLLKHVTGSFTYTSPEGLPIHVTYTADENGFHPQGEHLPVPPEIPTHIQKALDYIAAHPEENDTN